MTVRKSVVAIVALVLAGEIGLRVSGVVRLLPVDRVWQDDGFLRPGCGAFVDAARLETDAAGQRDFGVPDRQGRTLLLIGGEFLAGVGIPADRTLPAELDRMLVQHASEPVSVVARERRGRLLSKLDWIRKTVAELQPVGVVLQIAPEDLGVDADLMMQERERETKLTPRAAGWTAVQDLVEVWRARRERSALEPTFDGPGQSGLLQHSREVYRDLLLRFPDRPESPLDPATAAVARLVLRERYDPERLDVLAECTAAWNELLAELRRMGTVPVLLSAGPRLFTRPLRDASRFSGTPIVIAPPWFLDADLRIRGEHVRPVALVHQQTAELLVDGLIEARILAGEQPLEPGLEERVLEISDYFALTKGQENELLKKSQRLVPSALHFSQAEDAAWMFSPPVFPSAVGTRLSFVSRNAGLTTLAIVVRSAAPLPPLRIRIGDAVLRAQARPLEELDLFEYEVTPELPPSLDPLVGATITRATDGASDAAVELVRAGWR